MEIFLCYNKHLGRKKDPIELDTIRALTNKLHESSNNKKV
jgi:hypothetical protein